MPGAGPVQFSYETWIARYPEFTDADLSAEQLQAYFAEAGLYCRNDGTSPVTDSGTLLMLLNMLVAHLAQLYLTTQDNRTKSELVGRIASASEGSVSIGGEYAAPGNASWFLQTKYGASFWQASAVYRTFRYRVPRGRFSVFGW